jgi:hypothetical protein
MKRKSPSYRPLNFSQVMLTRLAQFCLGAIWSLHFLGLFTPETGFDAVWYHLPVIARFVEAGSIFFIPELYQSVNPLFSDLIFGVGYWLGGEFGTKVVSYVIGLAFIWYCYELAGFFLSKKWTLLAVVMISTFQVVSWQSSSFYVDLAKAMWEVAAVTMLLQFYQQQAVSQKSTKWFLLAGLFFGASLATKLFSLFLIPVFSWGVWSLSLKNKWKNVFIFMISSLIVAWPFYFYTYQNTGTPFYSFGIHEQKLSEIGGQSSLVLYFLARLGALPASLTQLTLFSRDYTTLLFLVFSPLLLVFFSQIWSDKKMRFLLIFSVYQYLIWWFLPPLSTRYALSGFVTLLIVFLIAIQKYLKVKPEAKKYVIATIGLAIAINVLPRLVVAQRQWKYLSGQQSKTEYIQQFYDGNIDQHLKKWHHLN